MDEGESRFVRVSPGFVPRDGLAVALAHLSDKTVAPPRYGLDVFLPGGGFAEGLAQNRDVVGKVALLHNHVRPNAMNQLIFVDEMAMRVDEYTKSVEDLRAQGDRLSFPRQRRSPGSSRKGPNS